jgi:hypothetical protein
MIVCRRFASESVLPSNVKDMYASGKVRKELTIASHPASFKVLEVKENPLLK